jgi:3-oxoacyl-[acyl-carrier protein] reductase
VSVVIVGGELDLARSLADAIQDQGTPAVTVTDSTTSTDGMTGALRCDVGSAAQVEQCLNAAATALPAPPALVRLGIAPPQSVATDVATLSAAEWTARCETPLRHAFAFHQATQRFLADRGGRIIVVVPTVGLSGGPGFVPWAATSEADRSLVKAQARVSGQRGITVNCVAVSSSLLAGTDADPDRGGLPLPALPAPGIRQVADLIIAMLGPAFAEVTGQTIAGDGGRWMAP